MTVEVVAVLLVEVVDGVELLVLRDPAKDPFVVVDGEVVAVEKEEEDRLKLKLKERYLSLNLG